MTHTKFCCAMPDGSVRIIHPAPEMFHPQSRTRQLLRARGIDFDSDEAVLAWIQQKDAPKDAVSVTRHEMSELPQDRTFRNAWAHDGEQIVVDMPKARTIHLEHIRRARKPELERLDKEWMKAMGQKRFAEADAFEAMRQYLRDIPQTLEVDGAETPEDLKALWPEGLPKLP